MADPTGRTPAPSALHIIGKVITAALTVFTLGLGVILGVGACSPNAHREPVPAVTDPVAVANAVNRLCYAFSRYTIEDLDRAPVEGDIGYLAGLQGVPDALRTAALDYWDDPRVRDVASNDTNRQVAGQRYKAVYDRCVAHGWKPGTKASDQPPKK